MLKLKEVDGMVKYLFAAEKDFVKNKMPITDAKKIISEGKDMKSKFPEYPICIDNKWFFEATKDKEK